MKTLLRAGACAAVLMAAAPAAMAQSAPGSADSLFKATTLNLAAHGETRLAPDMATITLGIQVDAPTAQAAMTQNAAGMNKVFAALKKAGISERDIQTSGLNLNAQYAYEQNAPPRLTGYQASNQVTIRVMELSRLGGAIDAVVGAGANQIQGVGFGLKDPAAAENLAREEAVKALVAKAELYARATGYKVARLVSLSEGGGYTPAPPMPMMAMARMEKDTSTPVAGGELSVRVDVTGYYELTR